MKQFNKLATYVKNNPQNVSESEFYSKIICLQTDENKFHH